ncbi:MAG: hypothetical protein HY654_13760 [Acidobacteria bacterium]|nr:hypothetical protein [Acidobacteriota bacterium]
MEASRNRIGGPVEQVLLYCFHYDPTTGRYSVAILNLVRGAGIVTLFVLGGFVVTAVRREKRCTKRTVVSNHRGERERAVGGGGGGAPPHIK